MAELRRFVTSYPQARPDGGASAFGSFVFAEDWGDAEKVCRQRGVGEEVVGADEGREPLPSDIWAESPGSSEALHALCWLGFLALSSKMATPAEVLGDLGFLHHALHIRETISEIGPAEILEMVREVEAMVPGLLPGPGGDTA